MFLRYASCFRCCRYAAAADMPPDAIATLRLLLLFDASYFIIMPSLFTPLLAMLIILPPYVFFTAAAAAMLAPCLAAATPLLRMFSLMMLRYCHAATLAVTPMPD